MVCWPRSAAAPRASGLRSNLHFVLAKVFLARWTRVVGIQVTHKILTIL